MAFPTSVISCRHCTTDFEARSGNSRYCSEQCRNEARQNRLRIRRLLAQVPPSFLNSNLASWVDHAICGGDTDLVWTEPDPTTLDGQEAINDAISLCHRCPVSLSCYREGLENRFTGIWGGHLLVDGISQPLPS